MFSLPPVCLSYDHQLPWYSLTQLGAQYQMCPGFPPFSLTTHSQKLSTLFLQSAYYTPFILCTTLACLYYMPRSSLLFLPSQIYYPILYPSKSRESYKNKSGRITSLLKLTFTLSPSLQPLHSPTLILWFFIHTMIFHTLKLFYIFSLFQYLKQEVLA